MMDTNKDFRKNGLTSFSGRGVSGDKEARPQYCMVGLTRYEGGNPYYVGSDIPHMGGVRLSIRDAERSVEYGKERFYGRGLICDVVMTSVQFAEIITTMNRGEGFPATLEFVVGRERIKPYKPEESTTKQIVVEANETFDEVREIAQRSCDLVEKMIKEGKIPKLAGIELMDALGEVKNRAKSYVKYNEQKLTGHLKKLTVDAKADVEAYIAGRITDVGIKSLGIQNSSKVMLEEFDSRITDKEGK